VKEIDSGVIFGDIILNLNMDNKEVVICQS